MVSDCNQRNVAGEHQNRFETLQCVARFHQGVSGAALLALQHKVDARRRQRLPHPLRLVSDDGEDVLGRHNANLPQPQHGPEWLSPNFVQHLGVLRFQARAFARCQNRDGELRRLVLCGLSKKWPLACGFQTCAGNYSSRPSAVTGDSRNSIISCSRSCAT